MFFFFNKSDGLRTVFIAPGMRHNGEINPWLADLYGAIIMTIVATVPSASVEI